MAKYRPKRHQQPAWSMKGNCSEFPIEISRWEKFLIAENIEEQDFKSNPKILKFIRENVDKFYVPTKVLKMYGFNWDA